MDVPRHWRTQNARYGLVGQRCTTCGLAVFPPRAACPACSAALSSCSALSGAGELYSFTTVFHAPDPFGEFVPYTLALIQLAEGPMVTAQLTDVDRDQLFIGMPVEVVTRRLQSQGPDGIIVYGYKFRPLLRRACQQQAQSGVPGAPSVLPGVVAAE